MQAAGVATSAFVVIHDGLALAGAGARTLLQEEEMGEPSLASRQVHQLAYGWRARVLQTVPFAKIDTIGSEAYRGLSRPLSPSEGWQAHRI